MTRPTRASLGAALAVAIVLGGCAAPAGTPGAGSGAAYTPIIDMQGVDRSRYATDLESCRQYAGSVDVGGETFAGALAGIVSAAAISSAYNVGSRYTQQNMNAGGYTAMSRAGDRAVAKQEQVLINCMASRGYRTLDGGSVTGAGSFGSPYNQQPVSAEAAAAAAPLSRGLYIAPALNTKPQTVALGADSFQVERMPQVKACAAQPTAALTAKGPGFEAYTVSCDNGDALMVRCEFGNCRLLR